MSLLGSCFSVIFLPILICSHCVFVQEDTLGKLKNNINILLARFSGSRYSDLFAHVSLEKQGEPFSGVFKLKSI